METCAPQKLTEKKKQERMEQTLRSKRVEKCFFVVLILVVVLWLAGVAHVFADESGSITLQLDHSASGVAMTLYRVTGYEGGQYPLQGAFADCGISLENLVDAKKT